MSKVIKRTSKISKSINDYIINKKLENRFLSCRALAIDASRKFSLQLSKSTINTILKKSNLSSPIGRPVSANFRKVAPLVGAGYVFLLGADFLLGFSRFIADLVRKNNQEIHAKIGTPEIVCEILILSKALYNVPFSKIVNYKKDELWLLAGKKVNKGLLKKFLACFNASQLFKNQIVTEFSSRYKDLHFYKIILLDGSLFFLDGQLKCIWKSTAIPFDFSLIVDIANSYVKQYVEGVVPIVIFGLFSDDFIENDFFNLAQILEGSSLKKQMKEIQLIDVKGNKITSYEINEDVKRGFIIGIPVAQYKQAVDLSKQAIWQPCCYLEHLGQDVFGVEADLKIPEQFDNKEVALRLMIFKILDKESTQWAVVTNLDALQWDMKRIALAYIEKCPDFKENLKLFSKTLKNPVYLESLISIGKIIGKMEELVACQDVDDIFFMFVEILNLVAKRAFFGPLCQDWSLLKTRELLFKRDGLIKRDMSQIILLNLFDSNMLRDKTILDSAIVKFNEMPIFENDKRKLWLVPPILK